NRLIRCVCGKKIGPDPRNFNQRVSLGRNDLLIRTFPKIGGFLRRTSLDELPQLFNVLKGEMSLVGPRPIITAELERYNEEVDYYLLSKPGMTGLWQVSGRSDVDYETRVYLDAWYVKNWSMWNDIAILFKTVGVVLKRDGAY
ncbi:sugar transferase, partial [Klebsiella pneumoniae]|nr:sugar transferase [Klebsiella pneumoniae]